MNRKFFILAIGAIILIIGGFIAVSQFSKQGGQEKLTPIDGFREDTAKVPVKKLVALGASMTKANNLSSELVGDYEEYSFVTGTKINSFSQYLKSKGENLTAINLAESGVNSKRMLQTQLPNAITYHPKYATIDIVADIFEETTTKEFKENMTAIVKKLKENDTIIFITTYPNLWAMRTAPHPTCQIDKLRIGIDKATPSRLQSFNQAIKEIAAENGLILVDFYEVLGPDEVSDYDCLHPNIAGQEKLAEKLIASLESNL